MPTPTKGPRMGGSPAHERHMLANLATSLFEHGRITTTEAKAKRLRPYAEHLITFAKRGDLHARRQVLKRLNDKSVVHTLFDQIGPRFASRPGGYTRIVKLGTRKGDNAPMALIELVEAMTVAQQAVGEAERARGSRFAGRQAPTGATREAAEELAGESATAAAVAAAPTVDEVPAGEATQDAAAAPGAVEPEAGAAEPAGSEILPVDGEPSGAGAPAAVVTPAQEQVDDSAGEVAAGSQQVAGTPAEGGTRSAAAGDEGAGTAAEGGPPPAPGDEAAGTPAEGSTPPAPGDEVAGTPAAAVTQAEAAVDEAAGGAVPGEHPARDGE